MRSSNPILSTKAFNINDITSEKMSVEGTVNKTGILLALVIISASFTWGSASGGFSPLVLIGGIAGFVVALITSFKQHLAPTTAPVYAVCQGFLLGGISSFFEMQYPGVVTQAVGLTFGVTFCLLGAYKSGLIQVNDNFKLGVSAATGGLFLFYMLTWILGFFGIQFSSIFGSSIIGIGFSLFVVVIASLNLVMDFDFVEEASRRGAPKYMEWYGAFGLMVTLIWLYVEILRLLSKLRDRN